METKRFQTFDSPYLKHGKMSGFSVALKLLSFEINITNDDEILKSSPKILHISRNLDMLTKK